MKYQEALYDALMKFGVLFEKVPSPERIQAYVEELKKYSPEQVSSALKQLKVEARYFPSLSEIIERINPPLSENDHANEMMGAIIDSLTKFGQYQAEEAKKHLGPEAWFVVERIGGWHSLCMATYDELNSMRAQVREMAKAAKKIISRPAEAAVLPYQKTSTKRLGELFDNQELKAIE
jgi:hypothetical protein